jgi:hypothetical protein
MTQILTSNQLPQPRIVTLAEMKAKLLPLAMGDKWAESAIVDLWKKGAPIPQPAGEPERRILIPEQFQLWFDDFSKRIGVSQTAKTAYSSMQNQFRSSGGMNKSTGRRG